MKVRWLQVAERNFNDQLDNIEARNPRAAIRKTEDVRTAARRLSEYPNAGRPGRVPGTRELVVPRTPYILVYTVDLEQVTVLRFLHHAQAWPNDSI